MKTSSVLALSAALLSVSSLQAANLLGYYEFEGNYNGSVGPAAVPAQNPGELSFVAGGFRGQALDVNDPAGNGGGNSGGSVNIPINANPTEQPTVTFGGWFNLQTNAGFPGALAIDNGGWDRGIHLNGNQWGIASGGSLNGVAPAPTGVWTYVVGTFDKPNDLATLYVGNDNPLVQTTVSGSRADGGANPGELNIELGRYDNQDLDALVDDLFVFDSALTSDQVNALRNLGLAQDLRYNAIEVESLFDLYDAGSGMVSLASDSRPWVSQLWSPATGLPTGTPGLVSPSGAGYSLVLDNATGAGLQAITVPEPSRILLAAIGISVALFRRRRSRL